ncbi:hypothetical protein HanPSC8_Chr10g0427161 [Helianthus annuus]|nr:hypothetical protein HanPSC8_Chr10g0427161 [Helianthus annuus]
MFKEEYTKVKNSTNKELSPIRIRLNKISQREDEHLRADSINNLSNLPKQTHHSNRINM